MSKRNFKFYIINNERQRVKNTNIFGGVIDLFNFLRFSFREELHLCGSSLLDCFYFMPLGSDSSNFFPHILHCVICSITILWLEPTEWSCEIIFRFFLQSCGGIQLFCSHSSNRVFRSFILLYSAFQQAGEHLGWSITAFIWLCV